MIPCVKFSDVEAFLHQHGLVRTGATDSHFLYKGLTDQMTVHKPNVHGDITLIEIEGACDAARLLVPEFETHWCD